MARRNYARQSGVIVDTCPRDGMWFDHEELRRLVEFVRTGGFDEAAEADAQRLAAEAERKATENRYLGGDPWKDEPPDARAKPRPVPLSIRLLEVLMTRVRR